MFDYALNISYKFFFFFLTREILHLWLLDVRWSTETRQRGKHTILTCIGQYATGGQRKCSRDAYNPSRRLNYCFDYEHVTRHVRFYERVGHSVDYEYLSDSRPILVTIEVKSLTLDSPFSAIDLFDPVIRVLE